MFVAVHDQDIGRVAISVTVDGVEVVSDAECKPYQTFDGRLPMDCYAQSIPASALGTLRTVKITATASSNRGVGSDIATFFTVPPIEQTITVGSTGEEVTIKGALQAAKSSTNNHIRLQLLGDTLTWPPPTESDFSSFEITDPNKLITIENKFTNPPTLLFDVHPFIARCHWRDVAMTSSSLNDPVFRLSDQAAHHEIFGSMIFSSVGENTKFNTVGVRAELGTWLAVNDCYFRDLANGVEGATSVRYSWFLNLGGVVFTNISRLIEGNVGSGVQVPAGFSQNSGWAKYIGQDAIWSNVMIRYNFAKDVEGQLLETKDQTMQGLCLVGNVLSGPNTSSGSDGVILDVKELSDSYLSYNTFVDDGGLGGLRVSGSLGRVNNNVVFNNYFSSDTSGDSVWLNVTNEYDFNASGFGNIVGDNSQSAISALLTSPYLIPQVSSSLLNRAFQQPNLRHMYGVVNGGTQVGAMPRVSDFNLTGILGQVFISTSHGITIS